MSSLHLYTSVNNNSQFNLLKLAIVLVTNKFHCCFDKSYGIELKKSSLNLKR